MSMGRPLPALELTAEERRELSGFAASRSLPHALVARARLVLWAAENTSNQEIAGRLGIPIGTVKSRMAKAADTLRAELAGLRGGDDAF